MKSVSALFAAVIGLATLPAQAEISTEAARAGVAPFYRALNAEFASESADLIRQATAADWVSCRGNADCNTRDQVIAGIGQRLKSVPDLKWEIKEIAVSGDQVTVRGEATGTPAGEFMGAPAQRQVIQADVDRRSHAARRQDGPLLPCRRLERRGPSAHREIGRRHLTATTDHGRT